MRRYDVCISFDGGQRSYARRLATALRKAGIRVFYDEFERARLWGTFLLDELGKTYYGEASFCIVLMSKDYFRKMYTDRERRAALLRQAESGSDYIVPIRMDAHPIHESLRGLAYLEHDVPMRQIVELVEKKMAYDSEQRRADVLQLLAREKYAEALDVSRGWLRQVNYELGAPVDSRLGSVIGVFVYNAACCLSRLSGRTGSAARQNTMLDEAFELSRAWLSTPALRPAVVRRPDAIRLFNDDDDLLALRRQRTADIRSLFRALGYLGRVRTSAKGTAFSGGGCVSGETPIVVPGGVRAARDLVPGDVVSSGFLDVKKPARITRVLASKRATMRINGGIVMSRTQHLLEERHGWMLSGRLRPGMRIRRGDGSFETILSVERSRAHAPVYGFHVASRDHTFVAGGYVCHNDMKG
jgi:TIR domain-containing protein